MIDLSAYLAYGSPYGGMAGVVIAGLSTVVVRGAGSEVMGVLGEQGEPQHGEEFRGAPRRWMKACRAHHSPTGKDGFDYAIIKK